MYQQLKSEIKDIIEIVNQCPESLKEKCFEILIENYLTTYCRPVSAIREQPQDEVAKAEKDLHDDTVLTSEKLYQKNENSDEEIHLQEFHVKVRKFLESNNISIKLINDLYYKESGRLKPLYESLNSNKMTECQNRLTLLTAFENSFCNENNEMIVNGEEVRQRCQDMKCYDAPHFADTFKRFSSYFDNWNDKYDKNANYMLSSEGKKALAVVLCDLTEGKKDAK